MENNMINITTFFMVHNVKHIKLELNMINKTTFFLEYYMINRTNYITDALKSNICYFSFNQSIAFFFEENFSKSLKKAFLFYKKILVCFMFCESMYARLAAGLTLLLGWA